MTLGFLGGLEALLLLLVGSAISLVLFAFWVWMLIDCLTNGGIAGSEKIAWVIVIVLLPFIGSVIYLFIGRPKRRVSA